MVLKSAKILEFLLYEVGSGRARNVQKPDVERLSDKDSQVANAKPRLWHFVKLDIDHVPAELARGEKKEKLVGKRVRWNPRISRHAQIGSL